MRMQVRAYHFLPPGCGHHLTVLYPSLLADTELNDLKLLPLRQRLHGLLGLPTNRPLLRPANALELAGDGDGDGGTGGGSAVARLRDVHLGLAAPGGVAARWWTAVQSVQALGCVALKPSMP